jgi:hypothetical protein
MQVPFCLQNNTPLVYPVSFSVALDAACLHIMHQLFEVSDRAQLDQLLEAHIASYKASKKKLWHKIHLDWSVDSGKYSWHNTIDFLITCWQMTVSSWQMAQ